MVDKNRMSLTEYFQGLIDRVESSDQIGNNGKDKDGFFKPTRTILLRQLNLLKDLHAKPMARPMVLDAWTAVTKELPPEWLILDETDRAALGAILKR